MTMLPRAHLPDQELVLSVVLNKNMTTSAIHPLYLPPVVCWINNTHEQVRFWKLKLYMALRLLSTCLILITTVAHALRLYSWESLSGVAAIWSLSVCTTLIWGLYIGATCASRRTDYDHSKGRLYPDFGVSKTSSFALCFQLMVAYMCTWLYSRTRHEGESTPADAAESHLYAWTIGVFVWINAVGFVRLFRHI